MSDHLSGVLMRWCVSDRLTIFLMRWCVSDRLSGVSGEMVCE